MVELRKVAEILRFARQPRLKDHIRQNCSMITPQLSWYLQLLVEKGLLHAYPAINLRHTPGPKTKRRVIYQTSSKGKQFLILYQSLMDLITVTRVLKELEVEEECGQVDKGKKT